MQLKISLFLRRTSLIYFIDFVRSLLYRVQNKSLRRLPIKTWAIFFVAFMK